MQVLREDPQLNMSGGVEGIHGGLSAPCSCLWYAGRTLGSGKDLQVGLLQGVQLLHGGLALFFVEQLPQCGMHQLDEGNVFIHKVDNHQLQGPCQECPHAILLHRENIKAHTLPQHCMCVQSSTRKEDTCSARSQIATLFAAYDPALLLRAGWAGVVLSAAAEELESEVGMLKAMTWGSSGPTSASSLPVNAARSLSPSSLASHTRRHAASSTSGLHGLTLHTRKLPAIANSPHKLCRRSRERKGYLGV